MLAINFPSRDKDIFHSQNGHFFLFHKIYNWIKFSHNDVHDSTLLLDFFFSHSQFFYLIFIWFLRTMIFDHMFKLAKWAKNIKSFQFIISAICHSMIIIMIIIISSYKLYPVSFSTWYDSVVICLSLSALFI